MPHPSSAPPPPPPLPSLPIAARLVCAAAPPPPPPPSLPSPPCVSPSPVFAPSSPGVASCVASGALCSPSAGRDPAPSDVSLDSEDPDPDLAATLVPSMRPSSPHAPSTHIPHDDLPGSPAGTSLSRGSEGEEEGSRGRGEGGQSDSESASESEEEVSDSEEEEESASEGARSASDTYYQDVGELVRDDPASWMCRVARGDVVRMYDSQGEDDPCEEGLPKNPDSNAPVALEEDKPLVEPPDPHRLAELVHPKRFVQLTHPDPVVDLPGGDRRNGVELHDVDEALRKADQDGIVGITGVHEALGAGSEDHELVGVREPVEEEEECSSPPSPSPSRTTRRRPPRPPAEELSDDDGVPGDTRRRAEEEVAAMLSGASGARHRRQYSDWAVLADDELSLEELQLEADDVTAATERTVPKPALVRESPRKGGCREKGRLQKRIRDLTAELANVQMLTAGWAADAESRMGVGEEKGGETLLRDEVCRLRITLNHLARLTLEHAFEVRDLADAHR